MQKSFKIAVSTALLIATTQVQALTMPTGNFLVEAGAFLASQGESQNIDVAGLVGDRYTKTNHDPIGGVYGLGYLFHGLENESLDVDYGLNAFYMSKTKVSGYVYQEQMYKNLSYKYSINHIPVYAMVKTWFKSRDTLDLTMNLGAGVNFLQTSSYKEEIINPSSLLNNAFSSSTHTNTNFTATAGIGLARKFGPVPVELSYQFFYLGEGSLKPRTSAILDDLSTGTVYTSALMFTATI